MVLRRCRTLLRDEADAVDALHDVFVEVVRRQRSLDVEAPSSFLWRTATNVCLNRLRSRRRHPQDADTDLVERIATAPDAEDQTLVRRWLDRLFGQEAATTRTMAVLHLVDGLTLPEVAEIMGMSESGVRKRLRVLKARVAGLEEVA
jgi:RNA polymerase sigma-70 factor (ECF subfamily)